MGLAQFGVCKPLASSNPMFGAKRLSLNRYESVVALTPNIGLILLTSRRSVRIDSTLDLREALSVTMNHAGDGDRATHQDGNNRNQVRS